jgi:hypothetical protein
MRRLALLAAAFLTISTVPGAHATPVPPGFASANVEWLANVPLHADAAGARVVGHYLYAADSRQITIYDISNPELPVPVGETALPEVPYFAQEDLETNGSVLVIGQGRDTGNVTDLLFVYDVRDKTLPTLVATLKGASSHTVSCILNCRYVYASNGVIVDLREPGTPKIVGDWHKQAGITYAHDVTEVAPGLVVSSSNPVVYLDARRDPVHPKVLAKGYPGDKRFVHANLWPNGGRDRFLLVGGETSGTDCSDKQAGAFMTWDTASWQKTGKLTLVDSWRAPDGLPTEGAMPVETYCTHWFTTRPGYRNGGLVAEGWYEHGTRFLTVSPKGKISETGWFIPAGTTASAAYWVTKDLVYLIDYNRGLDIVRFHDKPGSFPVRAGHGLPPTQAPRFPVRLRATVGGFCVVPEGRTLP